MECPECLLNYSQDSAKEHRRFHDEIINGVFDTHLKREVVIRQGGNYRVTVVINRTATEAEKNRAKTVASHAGVGIDGFPYTPSKAGNLHAFLLHYGGRIIGLLVFYMEKPVWRGTWEEYAAQSEGSPVPTDYIWTLGFVWIPSSHRRKGLAENLIRIALSYLRTDLGSIRLAHAIQRKRGGSSSPSMSEWPLFRSGVGLEARPCLNLLYRRTSRETTLQRLPALNLCSLRRALSDR